MGAAASLNDFGPFGDIHAVKSFCGEDFDQAKFDELKVKPRFEQEQRNDAHELFTI